MVVAQMLLPVTAGGELIYTHWGEDDMQLSINLLLGFRTNLVANLYLTGKVGLGFDYLDEETAANEDSRIDVGFKTAVLLHGFFM